jgi:hypothetical protein
MNKFKLRHSSKIYFGLFLIYVLLMVGLSSLAGLTSNWESMKDILFLLTGVFALYFSFLYFLNSRYQVLLEKDVITMRAASLSNDPKAYTSIRISDITAIRQETSNVGTTVKLRRPFRRIAIYDEHNQKFIDISLKHFLLEDIRKLIEFLKEKRPDLDMSKVTATMKG